MNKDDEMVLVLSDTVTFDGVVSDEEYYLHDTFLSFRRRGDVENDPSRRQIIPYLIVFNSKEEILTYKRGRKSGETRLHDLYTFGVGGHINIGDVFGTHDGSLLTNALLREIEEEIGLEEKDFTLIEPIGWVALSSSDVDKVHLGKIYCLVVKDESISKIDPEEGSFEDSCFMRYEALRALNLEGWSRAILPELPRLLVQLT